MKLKNKKRLFATLLASNLLIIPIISAACVDTSKNKKEDFDPQQATLNVKETSKPKNQTYSTQFQKANLQITYQGQTYDFDKDKNGFEFNNNTIVVTNFKPNKANGTLSVTLKYGENTSEFIIDGFKKIKPLDEISIFENDTEISSSLETSNHSEVFASSLTEQQLKESILVDEQKPSNQKFDIIISNVKADDNKGTLSFNAKVSFKESDPLDHQKNISKEISLTNFKTIDPTNSLNKSINRDDFKELRFVFKDQSKNPKAILPSEITNDMLDLQVGKKEIKDGKEQISWSPIDNNLYTWRFTNLKIVDDNKGTLAKEVIISFKENPTVKGRTQRFDAILSGLKTSKEIEHDQSVQPANVAFQYSFEKDAKPLLEDGLKDLHFNDFRSFQDLNEDKNEDKNKFANRMIEMYAKLYWDSFYNLSWNSAIKNYEGIFKDIPSPAQNKFLRIQSTKSEEYENGQDLWLSHITKVMPLVVGWDKDPFNKSTVGYDKNRDGKQDVSKIRGMKAKEGPALYNDNHVIYVPKYTALTQEEIKKIKAFDTAKKEYEKDKNNLENKTKYDSSLEELKKFLSIDPETFSYTENDQYLKGYYKFNKSFGENQKKPRLVLKSAVIEQLKKDHNPILLYNEKGRFETSAKPLSKFTIFASSTPMLKYAIPFRLPVDNLYKVEQKTIGQDKETTIIVSIDNKYPLKVGDKIILRASFKDEKNNNIQEKTTNSKGKQITKNVIPTQQWEVVINDNHLANRKFEFILKLDEKVKKEYKDRVKKVQILSVSYDKKVDKDSNDKKWLYAFDEEDFGNKPTFDLTKKSEASKTTT